MRIYPGLVIIALLAGFKYAAPAKGPAPAFDTWRQEIREALFIPKTLPQVSPKNYGSFQPAEGVTAERVTYATTRGMRIPAIIYRPESLKGRLPAIVVVNGHGGDKTSWYAFYTGVLYARAGAVVLTYDPLGEDERNKDRLSDARAHDEVLPRADMPARLGGQMIADIMQSVGYLAQRPDVDRSRIAVAAFSMGSFHAAIAGALDTRVHALLLSGGGNLDGNGGYWDTSKPMCQAGPYKALRFLGDRGAVLYALNEQRGTTFIMNGTKDGIVMKPGTMQPFFEGLRQRTIAITGTEQNIFTTYWIPEAGHRPNFITKAGALWLNEQLHLPLWSDDAIRGMPETHISQWVARNNVLAGKSVQSEAGEGGMEALGNFVPNIPREELQAVPEKEWRRDAANFTYESWVIRNTVSQP